MSVTSLSIEERDILEKHIADRVADALKENAPKTYMGMSVSQLFTNGIVLVAALVSFGLHYGKVLQTDERSRENTTRIESIDKAGTTYSRSKMDLDHQIIMAHESRLQKLEDVRERLATIEERLATLGKLLDQALRMPK